MIPAIRPVPITAPARLAPLLFLLAGIVAAPVARALDVPEIRCLCADGARTPGDRTSCTARLTQRLVDAGSLSADERIALIHEANRAPWPPDLSVACPADAGPWGVGIQTDRQRYRVGDRARVEGLLFNLTPDDVTGVGSGDGSRNGSDACLFGLSIQDAAGVAVHRSTVACLSAITAYPVEAGRVRRLLLDVDLAYLSSVAGIPDGVPLPAGDYLVRVDVGASYPETPSSPDGRRPLAEIAIRVEN